MTNANITRFVVPRILFSIIIILIIYSGITTAQTGRIETAVVHSKALEGNLLGTSPDRSVSIYLPSAYDDNPTQRFSVIYMLHGFQMSNTLFISSYDLKNVFDNYFSGQTAIPMIIVIPNASNLYLGSFYTNSIVTGNWEDFITQELVEYIDNNYRTSPYKESRGISGHSMGGFGAMKLAMKHPEIYSTVYSMSSASLNFEHSFLVRMWNALLEAANASNFNDLSPNAKVMIAMGAAFSPNVNTLPFMCDLPVDTNGDIIDSTWQKWLQHDPYTLIESLHDNLLQLNIKFDCGTEDFDFIQASRNFDSTLTAENIPHTFNEYPGDHNNMISVRVQSRVLPFMKNNLEVVTDVESIVNEIPGDFSLSQNYPNPFNPTTTIKYQLPELSFVTLRIYDVLGNEITTLVNEEKPVGSYKVEFDANSLSSGIYIYRLQAGNFVETKKMVLMK